MQAQVARKQAPARSALVVRASAEQSSRRAALGLIASTIAAGVSVKAQAIEIPIRASQVGMPKNTSTASMSSYTLEGTKKGGISPKRKAEVLAKVRKQAGLQ